MPNWCENSLTVTGPKKELQRFKKKVKGRGPYAPGKAKVECLSFHQTVPQPEFEKGDEGWYNWRVTRWGTKWEASNPHLDETEDRLCYTFETAWGPPDAWLRATAELFPELEFRLFYSEGGNYFAGVMHAHGEESSTEERDYLEAQIEEYGSYSACCEQCDSEVTLHAVSDSRVCDDCLTHVCANCKHRDEEHLDGKCLYDASTFKPLKEKNEAA